MDTASFQFVFFGLGTAAVSNLYPSPAWRSAVLMLASIVFVALLSHSLVALLPLAGFLSLGYLSLVLLKRGWHRWSACAILCVIFAYIWLKKYTFLPESILIPSPYFAVGLSYIFFRVLHLLIETADKNTRIQIGPGRYLLYMLNFTTLISGPIQTYDAFARDQFAASPVALGPRVRGAQM